MTWTAERIERLKQLWSEGVSASMIAAELGGVSRAGVIGKVHRIGLAGRSPGRTPTTPRPAKPKLMKAVPALARPSRKAIGSVRHEVAVHFASGSLGALPTGEAVNLTAGPEGKRLPLLDLPEYGACKWPVADSPQFLFCGEKQSTGQPYCACHAKRAFNPKYRNPLLTPKTDIRQC